MYYLFFVCFLFCIIIIGGYMNNDSLFERKYIKDKKELDKILARLMEINSERSTIEDDSDRMIYDIRIKDEKNDLMSLIYNGLVIDDLPYKEEIVGLYEIKNGKLGRPILDTTITGLAFEMLKTVDMVSDTIQWTSSGTCGKKQPMPVGMGGPALRCKVMIGGR